MTITGTGFSTATNGTEFLFGANSATGVSCASATSCAATTPPGPVGPVDVIARVGGQSSAANAPADRFTYATSGTTPPPGSTLSPTASCTAGNERFVCQTFLDLLNRMPDPTGRADWTAALDTGRLTRAQVAGQIQLSAEYLSDLVTSWYQTYLHRSPAPTEISGWMGQLAAGQARQAVLASILGSSEYYVINGSAPAGFINGLYQDLLGRSADAAGTSSWEAALAFGLSRQYVAGAVLGSAEAETHRIVGWYEHFLRRTPAPSEVSAWLTAFGGGLRDADVVSSIVGSPEYFVLLAE